MSESRRLKFQLKEKSEEELKVIQKKRPALKKLIDEILKERKSL
jgi:hypothetical protein